MIVGHQGAVNSIQIQGDQLVSASNDSLIKLWNISTGNMIREFTGHKHGLACVRFDGKRIVSGSNDHTIRVWDAEVLLSNRKRKKNLVLTCILFVEWSVYNDICWSFWFSEELTFRW